MKFRTEIEVNPFPFSINHKSRVLLVGSCFTSNIGDRLENAGFKTFSNPFGITFNPISLSKQIAHIIKGYQFSENELTEFQGQFLSFEHHSSFNNQSSLSALKDINSSITRAQTELKTTDVLFLSLGSAWVWERKESKKIVNNCHKVPAKEFNKKLLSSIEIKTALEQIMADLKRFAPNLNVVFTLSPVRHWRHGAVENSRSKSLLQCCIHDIVNAHANAHYFPSYEIMMDDLRDYRYYADDMLHPSQKAIDYIWMKFGEAFLTSQTKLALELVNKVRAMQRHRTKSNDVEAHEKFKKKLSSRMEELRSRYGIELD